MPANIPTASRRGPSQSRRDLLRFGLLGTLGLGLDDLFHRR
jgi:hypothetical protein